MDRNSLTRGIIAVFAMAFAVSIAGAIGGQRVSNGILWRSWEAIPLPQGTSEVDRLQQFLDDNHQLLGLSYYPEVSLRLSRQQNTAVGNRYVYQQEAHGLPVFESELVLIVNHDNITSIFSALSSADFEDLMPAITSLNALQQVENLIDGTLYRAEPEVELGYSPDGNLVYRMRLPGLDPAADWEIWMDAETGEILRHVDRRIFIDGSGQIFDPDPKTALEDNSLQDMGDANAAIPLEAYSDVTLYELDPAVGELYYLDGPFVSTSPTSDRAAEPAPDFFYLREDDRFEEVMVYYHIDHTQRYFQNELQTYNANNRVQPCNVNGTEDDNSWYSSFNGTITYGSGGVDDAEDADVIIHEYGHAVQDNMNPFWYGGHTGAMGEGFGDYLAGAYSLTVNPNFQPDWVFNWDGHNEFWAGRILNANYHYPENAGGGVHDSGQLWSAGLIDVWWDISDVVAWDRIILQHHFLIGSGALMEDAAEAILVTEMQLYSGIYRGTIIQNFAERGFIDPNNFYPAISHQPLQDTEDTLQTEFEVSSEITSSIALDTTSLQLFWRAEQDPYNAVSLSSTGNPDEFAGIISGPFAYQTISYYLTAADTLGIAAFLPEGAPTESFQFFVGPDPYPPQITWTDSLGETVFPTASFPVKTTVTDNIGIGSVELHWKVGEGEWQSEAMNPVAADTFQGTLSYIDEPLDQTVQYFVRAIDSSTQSNSSDGPTQFFTLDESANLEDFEGELAPWIFTGDWGLTYQFAHTGTWSLEDSPGVQYQPNSDSWAQWGEVWDMSYFRAASLYFWEMHLLEQNSDWGRFEVSVNYEPWEPLLEVTGADNLWYLQEIALDDFCGGDNNEVRFRFRTTTDESGNFFGWFIDDISITVEIIVPVEDKIASPQLPLEYSLGPIYPNPFNPETTISFDLPQADEITIKVFNTRGQVVRTIADGHYPAGHHQAIFNGANLASGIYFCKMETETFTQVQKLLLIK